MAPKTVQYDSIGESYDVVKELPGGRYAELPTVLQMLGDLRGLRVLDLACGTGFYARIAKRLGAKKVVGIDVSGAMIATAQAEEARAPLGITYQQRDVMELDLGGEFDIVLGAFLLNYATHPEQLTRMATAIRKNLRKGGPFVAITVHPEFKFGLSDYTQYGFTVTEAEPVPGGGERIRLRVEVTPAFEFDNWRWSRQVSESALRQAGFREISWEPVLPTDEGRAAFGERFWDVYVNEPILIGLRAST